MYKTEEEKFWAGEFCEDYIKRNQGQLQNGLAIFHQVLDRTNNVKSVLEFGSNIGNNLDALHVLLPEATIDAIEINEKACEVLNQKKHVNKVYNTSILDFKADEKYDLTFTRGVLIHIAPSELDTVYEKMYTHSNRYILVAEYYNPTPVEVEYRGHSGKLYKRDFAGEVMDKYPDLKLVDYGFMYQRDNNFPGGDITWFLLEK